MVQSQVSNGTVALCQAVLQSACSADQTLGMSAENISQAAAVTACML